MPKLSFKRKSADETAPLSVYLPTQMVDYTSLPPIEEETAMTRFRGLPLVMRIAAVLLPVLMLAGAGWGVWMYLVPPPPPVAAQEQPKPQITSASARVVSGQAIAVEAQLANVADGTSASAQLLADGKPVEWNDAAKNSGKVQSGKLSLRLNKAEGKNIALDAAPAYIVTVNIGEGPNAVGAEAKLEVPEKLRSAFFAAPAVAAAPTPAPTSAPTPSPTPEPVPSAPAGPPTLETMLSSTMLISPTLGTETVANVEAGATFEPLLRSADNKWFLVKQAEQVGWLAADAVKIAPEAAAQVALVTPDAQAVAAGPNTAVVGNGGNIRYRPSTKTGTVLGQLHAGQQITLKAQSADGAWFKVVAPEAEGWVSITLLAVDEAVLANVPTTK